MDHDCRIIIVGAGVFGLTTAQQLASEGYKNITVVDRNLPPVPDGSSVDISRIIRFDYADDVYMDIAYEAYQQWHDMPKYRGIFHPTPFIVMSNNAPTEASYYEKTTAALTKRGLPWTMLRSPKEAKSRHSILSGNIAGPHFFGYENKQAGWADAQKAIRQLRDDCIQLGVSFITGSAGTVVSIETDSMRSVRAVQTLSGTPIDGDMFIIAAGAWTSSLVDMYNSTLSTAQAVGYVKLSDAEIEKYRSMPICINLSTGWFCFPPHEETKMYKMAVHGWGYTRKPAIDEKTTANPDVSTPPLLPYRQRPNFVPEDAETRLRDGMRQIYSELADQPYEKVALCWYTDTPTGDFIVDYHPDYNNLFIAGGGSGHAFKFLPVLGKYTTLGIKKTLPSHVAQKWRFQTKYKDSNKIFKGDGSRGGPQRRELQVQERARL